MNIDPRARAAGSYRRSKAKVATSEALESGVQSEGELREFVRSNRRQAFPDWRTSQNSTIRSFNDQRYDLTLRSRETRLERSGASRLIVRNARQRGGSHPRRSRSPRISSRPSRHGQNPCRAQSPVRAPAPLLALSMRMTRSRAASTREASRSRAAVWLSGG